LGQISTFSCEGQFSFSMVIESVLFSYIYWWQKGQIASVKFLHWSELVMIFITDQYFMKFPKNLFRCPIECCQNQQV
jgi:hypothetical protein